MSGSSNQLIQGRITDVTNGQLKLVRTIGVVVTLCVLFVSWGITLGVLYSNVNENTEGLKENKEAVKIVGASAASNREKLLLMGKDLTRIRDTVTEINIKLSGVVKN